MSEIVQWELRAGITVEELIEEYHAALTQLAVARKQTASTGGFSESVAKSNLSRCSSILIARLIAAFRAEVKCPACGTLN